MKMTKEELEKESEAYADSVKCEWENDTYWVDCRDNVTDAYLAGAEPREKQIEELEQENAELKAKNKWYSEQVCNKECAEVWKQITKAKAIIESLLPFEHVIDPYALTSDIEENQQRFHEPFRKAEQFLKEVSE